MDSNQSMIIILEVWLILCYVISSLLVGGEEGGVSEAKWLVNRSSSSGVKAFTGAGRTLGGGGGGGKREDDSTVQDKV